MNRKQNRQGFEIPMVGGSSLLVIFAVLCLTVFALLSLSTVQADQRLGDASLKAIVSYYEADSEAEEIFARLRNGEMPDGVEKKENRYRYRCPISERQTLVVELEQKENRWKVLVWEAEEQIRMEEDTLPIWNG